MRTRAGRAVEVATATLGAPIVLTNAGLQDILELVIASLQVGDVIHIRGSGIFTNAGVASTVTQHILQTAGAAAVLQENVTTLGVAVFNQGAGQVRLWGLYRAYMCIGGGDATFKWQANSSVVNGDTLGAGATFKYLLQRFQA